MRRGWLAVALCAIALGLAPSIARAEETAADAKAHHDKGIQLYEEGAFDAALAEFERAYALNPSWKILYNIGRIHQQVNDFAAALKTYERYLAEGGVDIPEARRTEVVAAIEEMKKRVASVTIAVDQDGAEVSIDERPIGKSPIAAAVVVNTGHHRITATRAGRTATQLITVAAGDTSTITLTIGVAPPMYLPARVAPMRLPWIAYGVTAALAGGAVITGVLALNASTSLDDARRTDGVSRDTLDAAHDKTRTLALVTDVLFGATLVMAGVSIYLTVAQTKEKPPSTALFDPSIRVGVGAGSLQLLGSF